jgi:hypothetical protein
MVQDVPLVHPLDIMVHPILTHDSLNSNKSSFAFFISFSKIGSLNSCKIGPLKLEPLVTMASNIG